MTPDDPAYKRAPFASTAPSSLEQLELEESSMSTQMLRGIPTRRLESMLEQITAELAARADASAVFVSGVSLETEHREGGIVDLVVRVEHEGWWIELIRTPYVDDGVIAHSVYPSGIRAAIKEQR